MNHARALPLHRPLAVLAVGAGVLAVVLLPAMVLDDRQLLGVSVWLKPWKFAVSIALYALTMAWMVTLVRRGARLARAAATGAAVALGIEMAIITVQAARGVPSHFNTQTPLDARLFNLMGPASCWSGWPPGSWRWCWRASGWRTGCSPSGWVGALPSVCWA